jgi:hypothetical protein
LTETATSNIAPAIVPVMRFIVAPLGFVVLEG